MPSAQDAMRGTAASTPEEWIELWTGWPRQCAETLREAVAAGADFVQDIKWGNLFFSAQGRCILIHVEDERVVLGFMRGKRLAADAPEIRPSGKYELGNIIFRTGDTIDSARITKLARDAARLNGAFGDPTRRA